MTLTVAAPAPIDSILLKRRVIITCGTGGVGKTTVSAALAVRAAMLGKKVVVVTIDPAKRLVTSLGLDELGDAPTDLTAQLKAVPQPQAATVTGSIWALMPDTRQTFESFVETLSSNPGTVAKLKTNPIYQIFAREFSGTNEYMALEKLYSLHEKNEFDLIILDTPPSRNTLAFLDAPKLLNRLFEEKLIKWMIIPTNKILAAGMRKAFTLLEKLTGKGFMSNLLEFAQSLFEVQAKFSQNLKKIMALLESQDVGFILTAAPIPDFAPELESFVKSIEQHRFHFDGLLLNRCLGALNSKQPDSSSLNPEVSQLLESLWAREELAQSQLLNVLEQNRPIARLPELTRDVHTLEDLFHVALAFSQT